MAQGPFKIVVHLSAAIACFAAAAVIAGIVLFAGSASSLHDVASAARMPMPSKADVQLQAGKYGLYFGELNAPTHKAMGVPSLVITIVPPANVPDPAFVNIRPDIDVYVDGYHTVQVAEITVTTPGLYHVDVKSREQNGGSFSIGSPPATISPVRNVLRAMPFIATFTIAGIIFGILTLRAVLGELRPKR